MIFAPRTNLSHSTYPAQVILAFNGRKPFPSHRARRRARHTSLISGGLRRLSAPATGPAPGGCRTGCTTTRRSPAPTWCFGHARGWAAATGNLTAAGRGPLPHPQALDRGPFTPSDLGETQKSTGPLAQARDARCYGARTRHGGWGGCFLRLPDAVGEGRKRGGGRPARRRATAATTWPFPQVWTSLWTSLEQEERAE